MSYENAQLCGDWRTDKDRNARFWEYLKVTCKTLFNLSNNIEHWQIVSEQRNNLSHQASSRNSWLECRYIPSFISRCRPVLFFVAKVFLQHYNHGDSGDVIRVSRQVLQWGQMVGSDEVFDWHERPFTVDFLQVREVEVGWEFERTSCGWNCGGCGGGSVGSWGGSGSLDVKLTLLIYRS